MTTSLSPQGVRERRRMLQGGLREHLPTRGWGLLAAVCAAALLISFTQTVKLVVAQGTERRAQDAENARTLWRCNGMPVRQERDECRVNVNVSMR